jgi:hypothetical protein
MAKVIHSTSEECGLVYLLIYIDQFDSSNQIGRCA